MWTKDPTTINDLGIVLSKIPVSPKYGKMLVASHKYPGLLTYTIMIVACVSVPEIYTQQQVQNDIAAQGSDDEEEEVEDRDLVTSIDLQRKEAQKQSLKKQQREQRKAAIEKIRGERGKWTSTRSELISYAKMLSDYFTFLNRGATDEDYDAVYEKSTVLMEKFCMDNNLQLKAIKEVHYLCL